MSGTRDFSGTAIAQRRQNQVYSRNIYKNNMGGTRIINNPQTADTGSSRYNLYIPGAQTDFFRGTNGEGGITSIGGIVNIPPIIPSPVIYNFVTNGLTLYYNFGDASSYSGSGTTVNDLSTNGYTGTLVNGPTFSSANGGSLVFDGNNDYIDTNNSIASNSFTLNTWFKCSDVSNFRMLISKEEVGGPPWNYRMFLLQTSGNLVGDIYKTGAGSTSQITYSQNLADNNWHCVSFSRDAITNKLKLYIDGALVQETADGLTSGSITNSQEVWIGYSAWNGGGGDPGNYPFKGSLGSAFIYNRALTDDEVFTNFMATRTRFGV